MGRFRSGVGRLVVDTHRPVVPCFLDGGIKAWPKGRILPRPYRLRLSIGEPVDYGRTEKTADSVREICHDLERRVAELGRGMR